MIEKNVGSQAVEEVMQKVKELMVKNNQSQLFFKSFLSPIEIELKQGQPGLPSGLNQIVKTDERGNVYTTAQFKKIETEDLLDIEKIKTAKCNNLISLMKTIREDFELKLAICVCMYNENKSMLKRTLVGIEKNIQTFVNNGVHYNQIAVFVIMDGIEAVDKQVEHYFQELQKQSNIYLSEDFKPKDLDELAEEVQQDDIPVNLNHLVFNEEEFIEFKRKRFSEKRQQYQMCKSLYAQIESLQKQPHLTYMHLNPTLQKFFLEQAKKQWSIDNKFDTIQPTEARLIMEYTERGNKSLLLIRLALSQAKKHCMQYILSRDKLALMNSFRVRITKPVKNADKDSEESQIFRYDKTTPKMNLFMVTKYKNGGKLSSHNWFFNGFCKELKPKFSILLDVGISTEKTALWRMYSYMEKNEKVGGVCGYLQLRIEKVNEHEEDTNLSVGFFTRLFLNIFDIQRSQQFEYHFSHLINKPFESSPCFKFIHVLPGAFSGYRMQALSKQKQDSDLLKHYFKSIQETKIKCDQDYTFTQWQTFWKIVAPDFLYYRLYGKPEENSYQKLMYDKNVYLAEDRILCMGIHQNGYDLAYLADAEAWVDPVKSLHDLLGQRRRWINGSFFAFEKVKQAISNEWMLQFQILYLSLLDKLCFITPGIFMYTNHITMLSIQTQLIPSILNYFQASPNNKPNLSIFTYLMDFIYIFLTARVLLYSLHMSNKHPKLRTVVYEISTYYGVVSYFVFGVVLFQIVDVLGKGEVNFGGQCQYIYSGNVVEMTQFEAVTFTILGLIGLYFIPTLLHTIFRKSNHILQAIASTPSFIFYIQTYLNTLNIYALCKIDDLSWGTKGLDTYQSNPTTTSSPKTNTTNTNNSNRDREEQWHRIKIMHVCKFVLYNVVVGFLLVLGEGYCQLRFWVPVGIIGMLSFTLVVRILFGIFYVFAYRACGYSTALQNSQPQIDQINQIFQNQKQSLYNQIRTQIQKITDKFPQTKPKELTKIIQNSQLYHKKINIIKAKEYESSVRASSIRLEKAKELQEEGKMGIGVGVGEIGDGEEKGKGKGKKGSLERILENAL